MPYETLREKQSRFARLAAHLILWASGHGYQLTLGHAWRPGDPRNHGRRLALDLNLFTWNEAIGRWVYRRSTEAHRPLGEYWESLAVDCCWGGRFLKTPDGNHYSLRHNGVR